MIMISLCIRSTEYRVSHEVHLMDREHGLGTWVGMLCCTPYVVGGTVYGILVWGLDFTPVTGTSTS